MELLPALVLAALALSLRGYTRTWYHPSVIFAAVWAVLLALPRLLLAGSIDYTVGAWIIVAFAVAASLSFPFAQNHAPAPARWIRARPALSWFVTLGSACAFASALVTQRANGISISSFTSLEVISTAARSLTVLRYDGTQQTPILATILLAMTYGAAFAAPYAAANKTRLRAAALLVSPSLGGALYAVLTTARSGLLIAAAITLGSWIVLRYVQSGGRPAVTARGAVGGLAAGASVGALFLFVAASRIGGVNLATVEQLTRSATLYATGSIPAFSAWQQDPGIPRLGAQTFAGIAQYLVDDDGLGNAYGAFQQIGPQTTTNVFTAFRPLIEDFGVLGAFVALGALSVAVGFLLRRATVTGSVASTFLPSAWMGYVLFSQTTSIYSFTNVTAGVLLACVMVTRFVTSTTEAPHLPKKVGREKGPAKSEYILVRR